MSKANRVEIGDIVELRDDLVDGFVYGGYRFFGKNSYNEGMIGGRVESRSDDSFMVFGCRYYIPYAMVSTVNGRKAVFVSFGRYVSNEKS